MSQDSVIMQVQSPAMTYLEQATGIAISEQLCIREAFNGQLGSSSFEPVLHLSYFHGVMLGSMGGPSPTPTLHMGLLLLLLG